MSLRIRQSRFLRYNAGAFVFGREACLVDPGILQDEIAALEGSVGGAELKFVVVTHADWDHVLGPEHLPPTTIVAHSEFAAGIDRDEIRAALQKLEEHAGVTRESPFEPPLPDKTFSDELTLSVGALELRLEHAPGHSANMLTVYEPESATLWAADLLSDVEIPSVIDDLDGYERTLARISGLAVSRLVPGHGTPTTDRAEIRRRIDEDREYLGALRAAITTAVLAGRPLAETVAACGSIPLRRSEEDDTLHRLNVEKIYADLGGDAKPAEVGFARAWNEATRS